MSEIAHNDAAHHIVVKAHPIRLYLVVWAWLFVLSAFSYLVEVPSRAVLKFGWRDLQHRHRIGSGGEVNRVLCG